MNNVKDLTGQKFGKLTVISEAFRKKNVYWKCLCDCGNESIVLGVSLRNSHTTSCGCAKADAAFKTARTRLSKNPVLSSANHVFGNYKDGNLQFSQFLEKSQQPCHYCGCDHKKSNIYNRYNRKRKMGTTLNSLEDGNFYYNGLDRIDNTRAHDFDNVVPCCKWCNSAKLTKTTDEFIEWIENLYNHFVKSKKPLI